MAGTGRLTTHVLDLARGGPATGVEVKLFKLFGTERELLCEEATNTDGRLDQPLLDGEAMEPGLYELEFNVGNYFYADSGEERGFLELVPIRFRIINQEEHYHVPLLVAPGGYSTYRGS